MSRILFVCIQNAGRSQMAEAFAKLHAKGRLEVFSAGSKPAEAIHPLVSEAMLERGIDIRQNKPKGFDELPQGTFDWVVGLGCGDACPIDRAQQVMEWEIPNPKDEPLERVREIRDQIEGEVQKLLREVKT